MSRSRPFKPSQRACEVIGAQHEALLRSIGGNPCEYCSKRGSVGCAWEITGAVAVTVRASPGASTGRHPATEVASHLGP